MRVKALKVKAQLILVRNKFSVFCIRPTPPNNMFLMEQILLKSEAKVGSDLEHPISKYYFFQIFVSFPSQFSFLSLASTFSQKF